MRLINADALKKVIDTIKKTGCDINNKSLDFVELPDLFKIIDNAPTADAYSFEQVHELVKLNQQFAWEIANLKRPTGEWIDRNGNTTYPFWLRYECSICHGHSGMADYCYHCGAKMKGEEDG